MQKKEQRTNHLFCWRGPKTAFIEPTTSRSWQRLPWWPTSAEKFCKLSLKTCLEPIFLVYKLPVLNNNSFILKLKKKNQYFQWIQNYQAVSSTRASAKHLSRSTALLFLSVTTAPTLIHSVFYSSVPMWVLWISTVKFYGWSRIKTVLLFPIRISKIIYVKTTGMQPFCVRISWCQRRGPWL